MIDSHCHFDLPAFDNQRAEALTRAASKGVHKLLVPGLDLLQFSQLKALQAQYPALDIALGCHPYFLQHLSAQALSEQMGLMKVMAIEHHATIVAIGECGLDGTLSLPMAYQEKVLRYQIRIAQALNKPLILHHRRSHNDLIRVLKQEKFTNGGVVHAFSGSIEIANTYIELGFALGVGGTITYLRALKTRNTIKNVSLNHLLLETDAPDMPVFGFQGQANSPERLPIIADALATLKHIELGDVIAQTTCNYHRIFAQ